MSDVAQGTKALGFALRDLFFEERERLSRKLGLKRPRLAARRSSLSASISTMIRLGFGFLSTVMVAITYIIARSDGQRAPRTYSGSPDLPMSCSPDVLASPIPLSAYCFVCPVVKPPGFGRVFCSRLS